MITVPFLKNIAILSKQLFSTIIARLLSFPLRLAIRRKPGLMVVISRPGPFFADNSKYFFIYATTRKKDNERVVFLTSDHSLKNKILQSGGEALIHPSWRSYFFLLSCSTVVLDMADWFEHGTYQLTRGARIIQIWHGAPLKHIELDLHKQRLKALSFFMGALLSLQKKIVGRYPQYDVVVTTSDQFTEIAFKRAFRSKDFAAVGYPRNDILFSNYNNLTQKRLMHINVDLAAIDRVASARSNGKLILLYVPTYRKDRTKSIINHLDLTRLSELVDGKNALLIFKLHPLTEEVSEFERFPGLLEYNPMGDIYPLLPLCDFLITDYSSIFFDFLLLDRPMLFYPYDLDDYLKSDSAMYFPYSVTVPGPLCYNYGELEEHIEAFLSKPQADMYSEKRRQIRSMTHDNLDGHSARRLYDLIRKCEY